MTKYMITEVTNKGSNAVDLPAGSIVIGYEKGTEVRGVQIELYPGRQAVSYAHIPNVVCTSFAQFRASSAQPFK